MSSGNDSPRTSGGTPHPGTGRGEYLGSAVAASFGIAVVLASLMGNTFPNLMPQLTRPATGVAWFAGPL